MVPLEREEEDQKDRSMGQGNLDGRRDSRSVETRDKGEGRD